MKKPEMIAYVQGEEVLTRNSVRLFINMNAFFYRPMMIVFQFLFHFVLKQIQL